MEKHNKLDDDMMVKATGGAEELRASDGLCPRCGSSDVTNEGRDPFTGYNEYRCNSCGYSWDAME